MQKLIFLALLGLWATGACKKHDDCDISSIPTDTIYYHDTLPL